MFTKLLMRTSPNQLSDVLVSGCNCQWGRTQRRSNKSLTVCNMNQRIVNFEYAVRGPLLIRANQLEAELKAGATNKPFKEIVRANLGDAHAMGQKPLTFLRQVLACVVEPSLIECAAYPEDVKQRARDVLEASFGRSAGAYTPSNGLDIYRKQVADYIEERDGFESNPDNIALVAGASTGIKSCLEMFVSEVDCKPSGVMIPIPQYPLYSAVITQAGLVQVNYYLDEDNNWGLDIDELERSFEEASKKCKVRAIVVINPGNPTGQVLTRENIEDVIDFAHRHELAILADEVYQANIYAPESKFYSMKKILMESEYADSLELMSFMSMSKGYHGECGMRGGWLELTNIDPAVQAHLYKMFSAMLCPPTPGQALVSCVAKPPAPGEPSYDLFMEEKTAVLCALQERAKMVVETFNKMAGFKCNVVQGAMYAFPSITLPPKAIEAAKKEKKNPDMFYVFRLLEETGIVVVGGSGFGQRPGTYHFRTTILPQTESLQKMLNTFEQFHNKFTKEFS